MAVHWKRKEWPYVLLTVLCLAVIGLAMAVWTGTRPPGPSPPPPEPLEGRTELVNGLAEENVFESIERLPSFNDTVWAMGSMGDLIAAQGTYRYQRLYIPRLGRVRKILQEAPEHRASVVSQLRDRLSRSAEGFEKYDREFHQAIANSPKALTITAPNECYSREIFAQAATYLLEELDAFDALPAMRQVYASKERIPVSRLFLFCAMHELASRHPRDALSPESLHALDEYLAATKDVPKARVAGLPAWQAEFDETDFRNQILKQDIGLEKQPAVRMRIYPESLNELEDFVGVLSPKVDEYFRRLRTFVDLAYPPGG